MSNISIFAKPAFLNTNPYSPYKKENYKGHGHLQRVSSIIRGEQIANYLGVKLNPEYGYGNDVCVYVKPHLKKGQDFKFEGRKSYLDIVDGHALGEIASTYPEVGVIVCSEIDKKTLWESIPNQLTLIPQHHCNFERKKRKSKKIKRIGVIGVEKAFNFLPPHLGKELADRGIQLVFYSKFFERQDIIDFYMSIDLQIVWRPYNKILSNPLKIVNAASFGIPTIALDEEAFKEVEGVYIPCQDFKDFIYKLDILLSPIELYKRLSTRCVETAEKYHINNISKLYLNL